MLNDNDFMRYSRQVMLEDIGLKGQTKIRQARVLIIGLGGLGSPASLYLAGAGVGELILVDDDNLHVSNLQRQILYRTQDIPDAKSDIAKQALLALNPDIKITTYKQRVNDDFPSTLLQNIDLVLDCTDNMSTRQAINRICVKQQIPLISGSAVGFSGQLIVFEPPFIHGCYHCLYPDNKEPQRNCQTAGILGPVVGVIGTLQALEAIKLLAGLPSTLSGKLRLFDGRKQNWSTLRLTPSKNCPVCRGLA